MRGFTLIEVIVAITVLSTGIAGSVALINRTISLSIVIQDQLIAWSLAQEGMEVVHNIRNTNWIEGDAWDDGFIIGDSCVEFDSVALINPCVGADRDLYILGNRYSHNVAGTATPFSRYIEISPLLVDADGFSFRLIKSFVISSKATVSAEERLYDWK